MGRSSFDISTSSIVRSHAGCNQASAIDFIWRVEYNATENGSIGGHYAVGSNQNFMEEIVGE